MVPELTTIDSTLPAPAVQLTQLLAGCSARLHSTELTGQDCALLEALGLTRSCRFRVCKAGDPWILQVRETRIGLAASVACRILVVPEAVPEAIA
jgi:Fe2+ transport system protein FeoA